MANFEIIDNFLPNDEFQAIKEMMLNNKDFPYYYFPDVSYEGSEISDTMYFIHLFYINQNISSSWYPIIAPLINKLNPNALIRIKANLYPNINKNLEDVAHKDYPFEHKGAIFYINTNNGVTILEDGTKVESVANRLLKFEPHLLHNSTFCTDEKVRANININYF
jgi:hypothetical protein